jgi:catechol 2,3-dioxygenase-like lactoylglutathione lyase family enzyme
VPAESFFHVAVLVEDLEVAIANFSDALGITFLDPITAPFPQLEDPTPRESFCRCTYSVDGPPHIELIEANGDDGLWALRNGEGFHHLGFWEADSPGRCAFLEGKGLLNARVVDPEGPTILAAFSDPALLHGIRLEYLSEVQRPVLESWIATNELGG